MQENGFESSHSFVQSDENFTCALGTNRCNMNHEKQNTWNSDVKLTHSLTRNVRFLRFAVAEWIARLLTMREVSRSNLSILPLSHACRECDRQPCWLPRGQQVWHQRWISGVHRMQAKRTQVRDPPWLWNPGETSPEVQNRGISGPQKGLLSSKKFF